MAQFTLTLTRAQLRAALIFAADKDIRYYLNGVLLQVGECGDCRLVATDGHRLAVLAIGDHADAAPGEYIIPRDTLKAVKRATRATGATVSLQIDGGRVVIADGSDIISGSPLIDGKMPDWQRVCPDPERMSGEPGTYNAGYIADIRAALIELGDPCPAFDMLQQGQTGPGLVIDLQRGLMVATMPMRGNGFIPTRSARDHFMPRRPVFCAVVETAQGAQAFPCDPAQDVSDKRTPPEVVAHCGADIAAWIDPAGALQAAGLLVVAHIGDSTPESAPRSIRTIIETGINARIGNTVNLIHATAGMESAGSGARLTAEKYGIISDIKTGGTAGAWFAYEGDARAKFDAMTAAGDTIQIMASGEAGERTTSGECVDLSFSTVGMFTTFFANTKSGEKAWREIADKTDGTGKVFSIHAADTVRQLRAVGYTVAESAPANASDDEAIMQALGEYKAETTPGEVHTTPTGAALPTTKRATIAALGGFIGLSQLAAVIAAMRGEEGEYFSGMVGELAQRIDAMPQTYQQDGMGDAAMVSLHYFNSGSDWYITEKDLEAEQLQAFGYAVLNGADDCAEIGYISIAELLAHGVELDLYWQPRTLGEVKAERAGSDGASEAESLPTSGEAGDVPPSGEVPAAPACATLMPGRWIPGGIENAERIAFDTALGAEVWLIGSTRKPGSMAVIAYSGKRGKRDAHYTMHDRAKALQWAGKYMAARRGAHELTQARHAERKAKRAAGHTLKVGDVLVSSWGYDQTNIDYYEVTRLVGLRMVELREIGAESVSDGYMTGDCTPRPGHYIGEAKRHMVCDDGKSVKVRSFAWAHKIEPREVAGVKCYPVDHWTAYA